MFTDVHAHIHDQHFMSINHNHHQTAATVVLSRCSYMCLYSFLHFILWYFLWIMGSDSNKDNDGDDIVNF